MTRVIQRLYEHRVILSFGRYDNLLIDDIIKDVEEKCAGMQEDVRKSVYFDVDYEYDESIMVYVKCIIAESDKDYYARVLEIKAAEKAYKKKQRTERDEVDRKEYERLKKKFEGN